MCQCISMVTINSLALLCYKHKNSTICLSFLFETDKVKKYIETAVHQNRTQYFPGFHLLFVGLSITHYTVMQCVGSSSVIALLSFY